METKYVGADAKLLSNAHSRAAQTARCCSYLVRVRVCRDNNPEFFPADNIVLTISAGVTIFQLSLTKQLENYYG